MNAVHAPSSGLHAVASGADVLSDVLRSVRLTGAMLFLVDARSPWLSWAPPTDSFRRVVLPSAQHLVSFHVVVHGQCWGGLRDSPPECFDEGDILVVPHGDAYFLANPPDAKAGYGSQEAVAFFQRMAAGELSSVVTEGGGSAQRTQFICGFLGCDLRPFNPVLASLPRMIHLRGAMPPGGRVRHLVEFALCELRERSPGGQESLLRLAELMFLEVVRGFIRTMATAQAGWLAGLGDPVVARVLALLHGAPARHWTLAALAAEAGTSRSVLADRFVRFVGQPPMHYLAQWRMQLATKMLVEPGTKVSVVAESLGFQSESAFSRAFKKCAGIAPAEWRAQCTG